MLHPAQRLGTDSQPLLKLFVVSEDEDLIFADRAAQRAPNWFRLNGGVPTVLS
jgi:hypothetical protein